MISQLPHQGVVYEKCITTPPGCHVLHFGDFQDYIAILHFHMLQDHTRPYYIFYSFFCTFNGDKKLSHDVADKNGTPPAFEMRLVAIIDSKVDVENF